MRCAHSRDVGAQLLQGKRISNSRLKPKGDVAAEAMSGGAAGLAFLRVAEGGELEGAKPLREGLSAEQKTALIEQCGAVPGDLLLFAAGDAAIVNKCALLSRNAEMYQRYRLCIVLYAFFQSFLGPSFGF